MNCHNASITTIIVFSCFRFGLSEFYTAIADLGKLLETEKIVANSLEAYIKIEEERLSKLKWLSKQYADIHIAANKDVETFLSNPVHVYLLVKRLSADWKTTNRILDSSESRDVIQNVANELEDLPNAEDLSGAAIVLIRLQEIYLLDAASLARGHIKGTSSSSELTAGDCFELGKQAYSLSSWNHSLLWMQESLARLESEEDLQPLKIADKAEVLEYMAYDQFNLGNINAAVASTQKLLQIDPGNRRAMGNLLFFQNRAAEQELNQNETGSTGHIASSGKTPKNDTQRVKTAYESLCRGEQLKTREEESKLYCYYTANNNRYLLLQPVKAELLNLKPKISMFYDVLKQQEAETLKSIALPQLTRASVFGKNGGNQFASQRISKSAWLNNHQSKLIPKINQRIEDVTGLDSGFAEPLHLINYGIGGFYHPHYDFARPKENVTFMQSQGNRLGTWIFYLTDVPAGGSTVFPKIGVEVKPIKGAAVFWYDVYNDGAVDWNTLHAGCPVLAGSKWVATKWIHEFGNEFKRPCGLSPHML